jgi:hypothetical protein
MRILSIEHGVVDCSDTAYRLNKVSEIVTGLITGGRAKTVSKDVRKEITWYTVVADPALEDGIIDGLVDVVRAQDPSWGVRVEDGEGNPVN